MMGGRGIVMLALSALGLLAQAQSDAPKYSNEFLAIGVGARGLGMGYSIVAASRDVTAGYWNPAGIVRASGDLQVAAMHSEYFAGIAKYDYIGLAKHIDSVSSIGFSYIRFGIDDIPNTIDLVDPSGNVDYDRISSFSAVDNAFLISYARKLKLEGLRFGANAKVIYRRVGDFGQAWGFGLDAGLQYDRKAWKFAAMARDITSTFNSWTYSLDQRTIDVLLTTGNELPQNSTEITLPRLVLGVARDFKLGTKFNLLAEVDLENTFDGRRNTVVSSDPWSMDPRMGLEASYAGIVFVRAGVNNMQYIEEIDGNKTFNLQPNIGLGLKIKSVAIDYALTNIGTVGNALISNVFSLRFDINKRSAS